MKDKMYISYLTRQQIAIVTGRVACDLFILKLTNQSTKLISDNEG